MKKLLFAFLTAAFLLLTGVEAFACTAVYVGRSVSDDGTVIMAKSNDYQDVWGNYVTVVPRVENVPGRTMPVDNGATVFAPIPATTYRYTATPWMDSAVAVNGLGSDATICANEYGVSMIMSITSFSNKAALEADPLIDAGLTEFTAVDLVVCQSKTAREAVKVLCGLLDRYGSSEVNIALIADRKEAWYVEMYNGHQYAAVKLPEDKVCAFGNEFSLEYASDYEEAVFSPALKSLAEKNGFAVCGRDNELNLLATYSGDEVVTDYSHMRTWIGHKLLAPSAFAEEYDKTALYPLCFTPDKKVSLQDVMEIMRNRFDGTEYSPDETKRTDMRVIGTETALSVHIAQIYPDLPADMSCVTWESTGPAICGVFVPVSNAVTRIGEPYGRNQSADQAGIFDTVNYPYYRFKELSTLCADKTYLRSVRDYWREAETVMIGEMKEVLASGDAGKITDYCCAAQEQAFEDAGKLLNDVRWYVSKNSNSLKNGRNPETHEVLDELKPIAPLTVTLDALAYLASPSPYADVAKTDPFCEPVEYVLKKGIMNGVSSSEFAPYGTLSRGMIVTILYRLEGSPAVKYAGRFTDVPDGEWYSSAAEWAAENGIAEGYGDGTFGPGDPVTREQMAVLLYRYLADFKGNAAEEDADLGSFGDASDVSDWASAAVKWAFGSGSLGERSSGTLAPKADAFRWEAAAALYAVR